MLQRAASNAYSWWWASHVRTKQSKWLDQSLQDMEEKVAETLRILENDGDSFAKRADMYYRRRPELVNFVEESFRAYKALADRYDHLSKELQSANRTIASVYPGQVESIIDVDSEEETEAARTYASSPHPNNESHKGLVPKAPDTPKKDFRSPSMLLTRKGLPKRTTTISAKIALTPSSGLTKAEALHEIDKLQKDILALQTEKEFVRSIYEHAYEKYLEIEDKITEMQKRVSSLQDEFGAGNVIEDNDARALMVATALRSCQDTLIKLQEIQAQSSKEAKVEYERVKEAHEMFEMLRDEFISKFMNQQDLGNGGKSESILRSEGKCMDEEIMEQEAPDVGLLREKIMEKLEVDSGHSFTVTEVAERIDQLVNKVVTLETDVSSQTGMVKRLRSETDELQTNIKKLEEDKEMLVESSEVTNKKLKELEEELRRVKLLNRSVRSQDNNLQTHFTEASCNLEHLSGKLNDMKPDVDEENPVMYNTKKSALDGKPVKESEKHGDKVSVDNLDEAKDVKTLKEDDAAVGNHKSLSRGHINFVPGRIQKMVLLNDHDDLSDTVSSVDIESQDFDIGEEDQPNWRQMFISGLDDREKILLEEYTSVLRNYKDVRMKLNDVEKKNRDSIVELALQLRELKNTVVKKDTEINNLHQKLNSPHQNPDESPYNITTEYKYTPHEAILQRASHESNSQDPENSSSTLLATEARTLFAEPRANSVGDINLSSMKMSLDRIMTSQEKLYNLSSLEKKFRSDIDDLLEENLEFWLRFSTSVHQIQKFQNSIQDLKAEIKRIKEKKGKSDGYSSHSKHPPVQSQLRAIFRHLREIRTELSLWLEHNAVLQDELQGRYSSLCNIQDEIARAGNYEVEGEKGVISSFQAAKFQGEVLNMKQENSKVASELQAGLSMVRGMKNDVEKTLDELDQAIGVSSNNLAITKQPSNRPRIPLKSFLFGVKLKKQKQSLFACVNPSMHKEYSDMREGNDAPI